MSSKSVLIADDERAIREYFTAVLSGYGLEVVTVPNGTDALEKFSERPFDLVISDIQMPGLDGVQLTRKIREKSADQPILLITGAASDGIVEEGTALGAFILRKPMTVQEIEKTVETILNIKPPHLAV